jgi:hypothetical protein
MHFILIVHSSGDYKISKALYGIAIDFIVLKFAHKNIITAFLMPDPQSMRLVALKFALVRQIVERPLEAKPALLVV